MNTVNAVVVRAHSFLNIMDISGCSVLVLPLNQMIQISLAKLLTCVQTVNYFELS